MTFHYYRAMGLVGGQQKKPAKRRAKLLILLVWAWVELNYRPHAYQAASYEHELGSEVPTCLPFTNILLSPSRFTNILRTAANILRIRTDTTTDTITASAIESVHKRGFVLPFTNQVRGTKKRVTT